MPHDLDAEQGLLGCLLIDSSLIDVVADHVDESDFYADRNGLIFTVIRSSVKRSEVVDITTLRGELKATGKFEQIGGDDYLLKLTNAIPTIANAETYARRIAEKAQRRKMIGICQDQAAKGYDPAIETDEYLDGAEASVFAASNHHVDPNSCQSLGTIAASVYNQVDEASRVGKKICGIETGLVDLDRLLPGGLRGGQVATSGARPAVGKTSVGAKVAINAARTGHPVFIASLEMTKEEWGQRAIATISGIDLTRIRSATIHDDEWASFSEACDELETLPIDIDDFPNMTLLSLRSKCRRMRKRRGGLGLIVVDYLQLMRAGGRYDSREREVAEISRSLKGLAKELDVPVLALAQLNRLAETRKDKRPSLGDLRESGAIEQDSDIVLLLHRAELYEPTVDNLGICEIIIAKQRNGPTGIVRCRFDGPTTRFDNLQRGEFDEPKPKPRHLRALPESEPYWERS